MPVLAGGQAAACGVPTVAASAPYGASADTNPKNHSSPDVGCPDGRPRELLAEHPADYHGHPGAGQMTRAGRRVVLLLSHEADRLSCQSNVATDQMANDR
jgi:hypothetical protein